LRLIVNSAVAMDNQANFVRPLRSINISFVYV
jgi:hypothetical protein